MQQDRSQSEVKQREDYILTNLVLLNQTEKSSTIKLIMATNL